MEESSHTFGCRLAASSPRREVVGRIAVAGQIIIDRLECGHTYRPDRDRVDQFTVTRRCHKCRRQEPLDVPPVASRESTGT